MEGELKRVDTIARVRRAFHVQGWSVKQIVQMSPDDRNGPIGDISRIDYCFSGRPGTKAIAIFLALMKPSNP